MKKLLTICLTFLVLAISVTATATEKKPIRKNAREMFIQLGNGRVISVWDLSHISVREAQEITGKKMSFFARIGFRSAQYQLRKNINYDGTLNSKKIAKKLKRMEGDRRFHLGGFALGFTIGILGVLVAYMIEDRYKRNRTLWAWIGFAALGALVAVALALK